jgi:hypothetical protein
MKATHKVISAFVLFIKNILGIVVTDDSNHRKGDVLLFASGKVLSRANLFKTNLL